MKADKHKDEGWPETAYGVSKIGVTLMTVIHQRKLDEDRTREDIVVNAVRACIEQFCGPLFILNIFHLTNITTNSVCT